MSRMPRQPDLRRRLQWLLLGSMAAVLGAVVLLGQFAISSLTEQFVITRLIHDRDTVVARMDALASLGRRMPEVYSQPYSGHYYQIDKEGEAVYRSRSLWDQALSLPALGTGDTWQDVVPGPDGQRLIAVAVGIARTDGVYTVAAAEDATPLFALVRRLIVLLIVSLLGIGLVLAWFQRRMLLGLLFPVSEVGSQLHALEQGERHELQVDRLPAELQPLIDTLNSLLGRMQDRTTRSRKALDSLAHSLKTPLAILSQIADSDTLPESLRDEMRTELTRVRAVVDGQLRRARMAGAGRPDKLTGIADTVGELSDMLQRMHLEKKVSVSLTLTPDLYFRGDREDLLEMLGNVLENGFQWCRSALTVRLEQLGEAGARLTVADDGPGVAAVRLERLAERGARFDESVPGSGLGLAITRDIVQAYGGELSFTGHGEMGGLTVTIRLPAQIIHQSSSRNRNVPSVSA